MTTSRRCPHMLEAPPRSHWLLDIARETNIIESLDVAIDAMTPIVDAWRNVAREGAITQAVLAHSVAKHYGMAVADIGAAQPHAPEFIPEKFARARLVFPLRESDQQLVVAVADPTDVETEQLIAFVSGRTAVFEVAPPGEIQEALDARYAPDRAVERLLNHVGAEMA